VPAIAADLATVVEVVQGDELPGQLVVVRTDARCREHGKRRIPVALFQAARHL
jgi:hypothetical protein